MQRLLLTAALVVPAVVLLAARTPDPDRQWFKGNLHTHTLSWPEAATLQRPVWDTDGLFGPGCSFGDPRTAPGLSSSRLMRTRRIPLRRQVSASETSGIPDSTIAASVR